MNIRTARFMSAALGVTGLLVANVASADIQQLSQQTPTTSVAPVTMSSPLGCYDFTSNLKPGTKGVAVRHLQYVLLKEGFSIPDAEFGTYGDATTQAVTALQQKYAADILTPSGLTQGTKFVGLATRRKLNSLYSCENNSVTQVIQSYNSQTTTASVASPVRLAVTNTVLDSNGVTATFCNRGAALPSAPFRIRLNGINRDFEVSGAQKGGACETDTMPYSTWGLSYDPGSTFTVVSIIDPYNRYKTATVDYVVSPTSTLAVPAIPGSHLSVRSVLIKTTGIQATLCNLGTADLTSFPVRVTVNGVQKDFDVSQAYKKATCVPVTYGFENWNLNYTSGVQYSVNVQVDPLDIIHETNEFDNTATAVGMP